MLDSDTKRRIDSARDILVGKVPDPKSQVEQITIALIYKFMDDMDAQAEDLGGKRSFFSGDYARFRWPKLVRGGLGGHETLNLYAEAIATMPKNPGIPALFRDIFKNTYLPYRDPETLRSFLKIIDEFTYDHSERLGDAFEYLLSVLGSQGDAGQFRTPRHIIDFMVRVVDPKKTDTILDPACGTAGFLISAFKHIEAANSKSGHTNLTPDERKRLADGMRGYDISPDMVRLSLVNMYLHGFTDPHIHEYDTLTQQERWNETADVILANPPFMSPKGGIKPHNRFSVQSKRSEVLFVDYMAEHLTSSGRAAIIVPEGIIFQSQTAYKALRKMLLEHHLVAVVSLPQGVFNPYSGVKTSILFLDRARAKRSQHVLFYRVNDDGFELGATRKAKGEGDLPKAINLIHAWQRAIDADDATADVLTGYPAASIVERRIILESADCGLNADGYRSHAKNAAIGIEWMPLSDLLRPSEAGRVGDDQTVPVLSITMKYGLVDQADKFKKRIASADISDYKRVARNDLVVGFPIDEGVLGIQSLYDFAAVSPAYGVWKVEHPNVDLRFLELLLRSESARERYRLWMRGTAGRRRTLDKVDFLRLEIPLPPLEVQKEIVAEIEAYQKVIDGARAVLDHYRPHIPINPEWPMVELGETVDIMDSKRRPITKGDRKPGPYPYYGATGVLDYVEGYLFDEPLVLVGEDGAKWGPGENTAYAIAGKTWVNNHAHVLRPKRDELLDVFLITALNAMDLNAYITGVTVPKLNQEKLRSIPVPLPPVAEQEKIVAEIEAEQRLVEGNRQLIERMEQKIAATLARIWGDHTVSVDNVASEPNEANAAAAR